MDSFQQCVGMARTRCIVKSDESSESNPGDLRLVQVGISVRRASEPARKTVAGQGRAH